MGWMRLARVGVQDVRKGGAGWEPRTRAYMIREPVRQPSTCQGVYAQRAAVPREGGRPGATARRSWSVSHVSRCARGGGGMRCVLRPPTHPRHACPERRRQGAIRERGIYPSKHARTHAPTHARPRTHVLMEKEVMLHVIGWGNFSSSSSSAQPQPRQGGMHSLRWVDSGDMLDLMK